MPAWLAIFLLALAALLLGGLLLRQVREPFAGDGVAWLAAAWVLGTAVLGWAALLLAEFGVFSLPLLVGIWVLLVAGLGWRARRTWRPVFMAYAPAAAAPLTFLPRWLEYVALAGWLLAALWLFFRPHQFVLGAADAGAYVNLSAAIAKNGRIHVPEPLLAGLPADEAIPFLRDLGPNSVVPYYLLPGFYLTDLADTALTPQFYHLHPTWQAMAYALAGGGASGAQAALLLTGLWGLAGALLVALTARQLGGWQVGLLALAGITVNAMQIWFARYPTTEAMSQFWLWAGLWGVGGWLNGRSPRRLWALLGALGLGMFFLVRIDTVLLLPLLLLLFAWTWLDDRTRPTLGWFFLPLALLIVHSLLHGYLLSRPYFLDLFDYGLRLLRAFWWLSIPGVAVGTAVLWGLLRLRTPLMRLGPYLRYGQIGAALAFLLYAMHGWFIRPVTGIIVTYNDVFSPGAIPILDHENWLRLGWYLSPVGVWLGVFGVCLLILRLNRRSALLVGAGLLFSTFFLWRINANPHQIYAMRRYLPLVMPLFVVGTVVLLGWLAGRWRGWGTAVAALLAGVWLAGLGLSARGFVSQVDYPGLYPQLAALSDQFAPHAILLFNDQQPITQGDQLGTPLRFLFGHDVLSLRSVSPAQRARLEARILAWQADGRSVYLLHVPGAQIEQLPWDLMQHDGTYLIETTRLEATYDRRPTAIQTLQWAGDIYRLEAAP